MSNENASMPEIVSVPGALAVAIWNALAQMPAGQVATMLIALGNCIEAANKTKDRHPDSFEPITPEG